MNSKRIATACAVLVSTALASTQAFAAPWNFNSSGANAAFGWSGGLNTVGFTDTGIPASFGSPDVDPLGFHFRNTFGDMKYHVLVGGDTVDHSSVRVHVNVGDSLPGGAPPVPFIRVRESGTYGGDPADLIVQANFDILEWVTFESTGPIDLPLPTFFPNGTWTTEYTLTLADAMSRNPFYPNLPFTEFDIQITNILQVQGSTPGTFIRKGRVDIFFPEPTTLALLAFFGPLVLRRRSR